MRERRESRTIQSSDGLKLHLLDFHPANAGERLPLVCLPGLTRSSADFVVLAAALSDSASAPRRVVALDYRGRGLSDHDKDWRRYSLDVEREDVLLALDELGIARAHWFGTSRGGLHLMAMSQDHGDRIASAVLNDIGPVLEKDGLARIKGYIGVRAAPASYREAVEVLKAGSGKTFTAMDDDLWRLFAETTFGEDESDLRLRYDPALAHVLDGFDPEADLPSLWPQFDALAPKPLLVIRGEHSDLLSRETVTAMEARWPGVRSIEVAGQGHAPIVGAALADIVADFLRAQEPGG